ncbi:hypothetical protein LTR84_005666 [Exophiala bonariae]|uniref:CBF1-interacting co-repressor CIR N-terminal domain-containing protein n=1 Tax=Exophiala bonariae TaxID=1690606 RepID=A0AAV9N727_9EURO|nr:hypothetical protein LTR84_005666 [Exophiala bonariae]
MPLHLLGKKSWNVYNPASIAKVRQDEAEAHKREQEEERRQRQDEASDRLAILRGERDPTLHESRPEDFSRPHVPKKRKLPGEDDTDLEIRLAQAQTEKGLTSNSRGNKFPTPAKSQDHSITDANGHISLIPNHAEQDQKQKPSNEKPDSNPSHFYLTSAAAHGSSASDVPWYSTSNKTHPSSHIPSKEPWGETSPRRKERQAARMSSSDPLAAMKRGVKQLRESERQRKEWRDQRERDLREVEDLARRRDRERKKRKRDGAEADLGHGSKSSSHRHQSRDEGRKRKRADPGRDDPEGDSDVNSLDGFDLDEGYANHPENEKESHRHSRHHHYRHRHRHDHGHSHRSHKHRRHRSRSRSPRKD